ncbi:MAG TPA: hypothetical protein VGB15_09460 [Longimicrobium sp.]|jgi:tetratricopeptide (TPR) repeat protein
MPEISPELAARIETLRASHAENPARFFMPLASAYREAGEAGRAEELLRENLKRHPGYLSAHVLLGRCLADRGAYVEARNEFQYVLSVDAQNLIALRTLGDMAAGAGDAGEARRWYGELLAVDPMNAEARQALVTLENTPDRPAPQEEQGGFGMVDIAAHAPEADLPHAGDADPGAWGAVSLDEPVAEPDAPAPRGEDAGGFDALDFGAVDLTVADEQPEQSASALADAEAEAGAGFAAAPGVPAANDGGFDAWGSLEDEQLDSGSAGMEPLPLETFYDPAEPSPTAAPGHHDEHEEHDEVVTETIAELYAQQGFADRAAEVYRELIARRGEEPALVRRLGELEAQLAGGAATAPSSGGGDDFGMIDLDTPAEPAQAGAGAADATPGWLESVDAFVSGGNDQRAAGDFDLPTVPELGGDVEFGHAAGAETPSTEPAPAGTHASASPGAGTGDAFADSFADGFDGAGDARREWEAPTVEETAPAPELAFAASAEQPPFEPEPSFDTSAEMPPSADPEPVFAAFEEAPQPAVSAEAAAETPAAAPSAERVTISSYLGSILSWRPGAGQGAAVEAPAPSAPDVVTASGPAPVDEAPAEDAAAPPPARPWDEETLGAPVEQPPMDEPWIAPSAAGGDDASVADEPWAAAPPAAAGEQDEPWAAPAAEPQPGAGLHVEPWTHPASDRQAADDAAADPWSQPLDEPAPDAEAEPWNTPAAESADAGEDLPWLSEPPRPDAPEQGTEPAAGPAASAGERMPWEASFDLSPEVPQEPVADRAPPRQEPQAEPAGGFSFEDFFAEQPAAPPAEPRPQAAAPAPMFEPMPPPQAAPAEPAQPAQQQGGDEDEDLESFQAWLQSLKR